MPTVPSIPAFISFSTPNFARSFTSYLSVALACAITGPIFHVHQAKMTSIRIARPSACGDSCQRVAQAPIPYHEAPRKREMEKQTYRSRGRVSKMASHHQIALQQNQRMMTPLKQPMVTEM